jgi:hypothetical protein
MPDVWSGGCYAHQPPWLLAERIGTDRDLPVEVRRLRVRVFVSPAEPSSGLDAAEDFSP